MKTIIFGVGEESCSYYIKDRCIEKIVAFADNNPGYYSKAILVVLIYNPQKINSLSVEKILIMSKYHEKEIRDHLQRVILFKIYKIWIEILSDIWEKGKF